MTPKETEGAISGFFTALNFTIDELEEISRGSNPKQGFLDRLDHYVKRVTSEYPEKRTLTEKDADNVIRLHSILLASVHRIEPYQDQE